MKFQFLFFVLFLFSFGFVQAISSSEAISFIQQENHFLKDSEFVEIFPDAFVSHNAKDYWVAAIVSNDSIKGFISVEKDRKELVSLNSVNRELFKTGFIARSIVSYKTGLSRRGVSWFFSSSNATLAGSLSRFLGDESFDLLTIRNELSDADALSTIDSMDLLLDEMSQKAAAQKIAINDTIDFESGYLIQPDSNQTDDLRKKYSDVFELVRNLEQDAISYDALVSRLKQFISQSDLDVAEKNNLINLATPPEGFYNIGSWSLIIADLEQGIDGFFDQSNANISSWLDNLENRIKMNNAWFLLYGEDSVLFESTGNNFSSLKQANDYVFSDEVVNRWNRQDLLQELNNNWSKAVTSFNNGSFDSVQGFSSKAKNSVIQIYDGGLVEVDAPNFSVIALQLVVGLVVLLLILMVLRKRKKFSSQEDDDYGNGENSY